MGKSNIYLYDDDTATKDFIILVIMVAATIPCSVYLVFFKCLDISIVIISTLYGISIIE